MTRLQQTGHALGSEVVLTVIADKSPEVDSVFEQLWQQIATFEQRFSRFKTDSELSIFNAAAGSDFQVDPAFVDLLTAAQAMGQKTGGLYNPFILPALQRAGYKGSWPTPDKADAQLDYADRKSANWSDIQIGDDWAMIPTATALDFGGIGKGYLLDELGLSLQDQGYTDYWLSLGGDILCSGLDAPGTPWEVAISDARDDNVTATSLSNDGKLMAIATSGVTKRKGTSRTGSWHHIIDPRTNEPAETDVLTATVCATSATAADVYAKCLVITGSNDAVKFCRSIDQKNAYLQMQGDEEHTKSLQIGAVWSQ